MKKYMNLFFVLMILVLPGYSGNRMNDIRFICMKTHKASNTCHFNFKVEGANYRFVDVGCKYSKKKEDLIKKVEEGSIFLAKDWKIACPEPKETQGL